jgi:hypothetical protein
VTKTPSEHATATHATAAGRTRAATGFDLRKHRAAFACLPQTQVLLDRGANGDVQILWSRDSFSDGPIPPEGIAVLDWPDDLAMCSLGTSLNPFTVFVVCEGSAAIERYLYTNSTWVAGSAHNNLVEGRARLWTQTACNSNTAWNASSTVLVWGDRPVNFCGGQPVLAAFEDARLVGLPNAPELGCEPFIVRGPLAHQWP